MCSKAFFIFLFKHFFLEFMIDYRSKNVHDYHLNRILQYYSFQGTKTFNIRSFLSVNGDNFDK